MWNNRTAVAHVFACTHTLATVQAEIFHVSQLFGRFFCLFFPPNAFFHLGRTKLLRFNCTIRWLVEQPMDHHCIASCSPQQAVLKSKLQEWSSSRTRAQAHTTSLFHFSFLLTPCLFFPSLWERKKKKFILGIKLSLRTGKLMLVSLNKGCAKQKSFPWGKDLQVMPSLHCLFLFQAVEVFGTMRPRSLTESHSIITVYITYLYNKVEVTNASFSHSALVSQEGKSQ